MTDESIDAQVERLLSRHAPDVRAIASSLCDIVRGELPAIVEHVDFGSKLIAFGHGMRMRDLLFAVIPHTAHVNLQLADGVDLPDPTGLVEGTGKRIRHVKLRSVEAAQAPAVRKLVRAQLAARRGRMRPATPTT